MPHSCLLLSFLNTEIATEIFWCGIVFILQPRWEENERCTINMIDTVVLFLGSYSMLVVVCKPNKVLYPLVSSPCLLSTWRFTCTQTYICPFFYEMLTYILPFTHVVILNWRSTRLRELFVNWRRLTVCLVFQVMDSYQQQQPDTCHCSGLTQQSNLTLSCHRQHLTQLLSGKTQSKSSSSNSHWVYWLVFSFTWHSRL